jgi:hypothetical protein
MINREQREFIEKVSQNPPTNASKTNTPGTAERNKDYPG